MKSESVAYSFIQSGLKPFDRRGLHCSSTQFVHGPWILNHFPSCPVGIACGTIIGVEASVMLENVPQEVHSLPFWDD